MKSTGTRGQDAADPASEHLLSLRTRAVLFDMDGTLVDSTVVVERTWRRFADRHGLDAAAILSASHGRRTGETVAAHAPEGVDVAAETERLVAEEVADVDGIVPLPGAARLLEELPPGSWSVVTSAGRELATRRMRAAGLPIPPVIVVAEDVAVGKPDPEGYRMAAAALGVPVTETVVFEDAEAGMRAALAAGARLVAVGARPAPGGHDPIRVDDFSGIGLHAHPDGTVTLTFPSPPPGG